MKQTINFSQFCDAFHGDRNNQFSYEAKRALFDYFEAWEVESGEEVELDVIAICCEWTEYENFEVFKSEYSLCDAETLEELEQYTQVIRIPCSEKFLIQQF